MRRYLVFVYKPNVIKRVIRALERNGRVQAIIVVADVDDPRAIGGIRNIDRDSIAITQGYLPLIEPRT